MSRLAQLRRQETDDDSLRFSELEEHSDGDDENAEDLAVPEEDNAEPRVVGLRHLNDMKSMLGLDALKAKRDKRKERKQRAKSRKKTLKSSGQIVTLASQLKSTPPAQVVKYEDPRKRSKKREEKIASERGESILQKEEVTMKAARFDVFKFGLSGFGKEDREDAEVARLIRLGAKPAKNKCLPYAEFKERQKKEKEEERKRKEVQRLSGMTTAGKRKANSAAGVKEQKGKKKKKAGSDSIQSKVGKFDGGMLRLSAKDLAKIKGGK